jgi:hypothetical protein
MGTKAGGAVLHSGNRGKHDADDAPANPPAGATALDALHAFKEELPVLAKR